MVKSCFWLVGLWLLSFKYVQSQDSLKCWTSKEKLKWGDFKGHAPSAGLRSLDKASCSSWPEAYSIDNDSLNIYKVRAVFNRHGSWVKAKDTSKYLLAHEQLHFDITELYARKLRGKFMSLGNWSESIEDIYHTTIKKIYADHIAYQDKYDAETVHGTNKTVQQAWSKKIHLELEELKEYASTAADCNQKAK